MIRTILVTSRAAIRSNEKLGRSELAVESARRGLLMLEELRTHLSRDSSDAVRDQYERARRELMRLAGEPGPTGFTIGTDISPTPASPGATGSEAPER